MATLVPLTEWFPSSWTWGLWPPRGAVVDTVFLHAEIQLWLVDNCLSPPFPYSLWSTAGLTAASVAFLFASPILLFGCLRISPVPTSRRSSRFPGVCWKEPTSFVTDRHFNLFFRRTVHFYYKKKLIFRIWDQFEALPATCGQRLGWRFQDSRFCCPGLGRTHKPAGVNKLSPL